METQSAFMAFAAASVLLVAVLVRRRDRPGLRYAAMCAGFGLWSLGRGALALELDWATLPATLGLACVGPATLGFAAGLTSRLAAERRLVALYWAGSPLVAVAGLGARPEWALWVEALLVAWSLAGVLAAGPALWREQSSGGSAPEATRLRYLAIAHAVLCAGLATDLALWRLGTPRVASLLTGLLYLYAGYLLLARVRIADLRQLMGNALALGLLAGGLAGIFAALRLWVGTRLDLFVFNAFVASFLLLLFYEPARDYIQRAIEQRFVAGKVELERTLAPLRDRMAQIFTLDELLRELLATLELTDRVTGSSIFLRENPHLGFQQAASTGLSPRPRVNLIRQPSLVSALEAGEVLLCEELDKALEDERSEPRRARLEELRRIMRELDAQLVLPLRTAEHLLGFWTLTDSESMEPFSSTEVDFLRSIAHAAAVSIENSKTFERIRARDRLASLGEMAAGMAHELRNPLAAIRGALAVLDESNGEPRSELSEVIVEEVQRLDRVVGAFLDYARPSLHRAPIEDFAGFVESAVAVARRHAGCGIDLRVQIDAPLPPVTADRHQLETAIGNLLQNACEALEEGGRVRVSVRADVGESDDGNSVAISVSDDGPGMDEATLERAFVPFYTTKEGGTGLGLALCERLIQAQGGTIELRSKPGEGTVVTVRLPAGTPVQRESAT